MYSYVSLYILLGILVRNIYAQDVIFGDPFGGGNGVVIGSSCTTGEGGTGRCFEYKKCKTTLANKFPVLCGFNGHTAIVCCPSTTEPVTEDPNSGAVPLNDISSPDFAPGFFCGRSATKLINFRRNKRASAFPGRRESVAAAPEVDVEDPVIGGIDSQRSAWPWMALLGSRENFFGVEGTPGLVANPGLGGLASLGLGGHPGLVASPGLRRPHGLASSLGLGERPGLLKEGPFGIRDFETDWFCGGVLINEQWVLTAAHCLTLKEPNVVRLGEHDYTDVFDGASHQDFTILKMIRYPNYTFPVAYHDLALLQLSRKVTLQTFISPVCLPWGDESQKDLTQKTVKLTGWGDTEYAGKGSSILQEVDLTMFPTSKCQESYSKLRHFRLNWPKGMAQETACAGDVDGGRDACQGDSGGPITYRSSNGRYVVNGIVSTGYGCGNKNYPGIYANVQYPPYLAWIKKVAF